MRSAMEARAVTALDAYADPGVLPASEAVRLARLLSLEVPGGFDDVALARRVSEGLPAKSVTGLARCIGRARIIGPVVPEPTLRPWPACRAAWC
jgi:hypothetical protein